MNILEGELPCIRWQHVDRHSVAFMRLEWDLQVEFDPELVEPAECFTGLGKLSAS